jgi:hypothetical protein
LTEEGRSRNHPNACIRPPGWRRQTEVPGTLRLLRELLKRDYAVGYLLLSWLLKASWTIIPAVAMLLGIPNPRDKGGPADSARGRRHHALCGANDGTGVSVQQAAGSNPALQLCMRSSPRPHAAGSPQCCHCRSPAARDQLPALLLWLASADGEEQDSPGDSLRHAEALASALTPAQLEELSSSLRAPTAALAVFTQFLRAQQALEGAPATLGQVGRACCVAMAACTLGAGPHLSQQACRAPAAAACRAFYAQAS